ncbi:MAG: hypothetical protein KME16_04240 [Scytolyngbya sp. HA4215-MV1]|nr:hypothetical protein [Scytolyngbya sp. HA4215-MV1]
MMQWTQSSRLVMMIAAIGFGFSPIALSAKPMLNPCVPSTRMMIGQTIQIDRSLELSGIDPQAAKEFVAKLRSAAIKSDRKALVALVRFPFTTYANGHPKLTYRRAQDLLHDFHRVFTPKVLRAMRQAEYARLFVNAQGAMIGNGEVWFDQRQDGIKIRAIN